MAGFPIDASIVRADGPTARTSRMPRRASHDTEETTARHTRAASGDSYCHLVTALLHLAQGNVPLAHEHLSTARQLALRHEDDVLLYQCMTAEAALAHREGDTAAMQTSLARAEALAPTSVWPVLELPHRLLAAITAPAESEPRAIRITTLGHFGIAVQGVPLDLSAIRQKKPLELLRALIALGGRDVPITHLYEALWPEVEGDAAHRNFTIALHRLRRLFDVDFIALRDGRLGLDPRQCDVDLWVLERHIRTLEPILSGNDPDRWVNAGDRLFALDCRSFLEGEDAPWAYSVRERLRGKCLHILSAAARALSRANRHPEAIRCCRHGLAIDPLAEELYRLQMHSQQQLGEAAAALVTYRQCRDTLQRELGVAPSRDTEMLGREIRAMAEVSA